jgi:hypothetical protein
LAALFAALTVAVLIPVSAWSDPFTLQGGKLTGEPGFALFGADVALSSDGNTALIGEPGPRVPWVWIFTRTGSTWTKQAQLKGAEVTRNECGYAFARSVALSSDGNTALIGGRSDCEDEGYAWVFTRSGSTWTQQGPRIADPDSSSDFGASVALSADGNTALIGGPNADWTVGKSAPGAAWVFTREGSTWTQSQKLTGGGETGPADFGQAVALSSAGDTALVTGGNDRKRQGAAWVFTRAGSTWTQQGEKLKGAEEIVNTQCCNTFFGASAALSTDGNTALVGGEGDNVDVGAAWVFTRSGSSWTQQGPKLTGGGELSLPYGLFGGSVALGSDGNTALIGAWGDNEYRGATWVFTRSGSTWSQQGEKFTDGEGTGQPHFGASVALSSDAKTALIGGPYDGGGSGAAWVFVNASPIVTHVDPIAGSPAGGTTVTISGTNFTGATAVTFGSANAVSFEVNSESGITAVSPPGKGTVDVTVTAPEGTSPFSVADQFVYSLPPTLTKLAPTKGPVSGGTTVTITGTNFVGTEAVRFGGGAATGFVVNSATKITAVSPAEPAGTVDLTVTTSGGTTAITTVDHFKFTPTITSVSPNSGATTGATTVAITGAGFALGTTATKFKFGTTLSKSVNCTSTTECTAVTPAHAAGTVDVHAVVNKVTSPKNAPVDQFTYN